MDFFNEKIRKEYHHLDTCYFNTAYFGPSPYRAKQKVSKALQNELDPSFNAYQNWFGVSERMRIQIAEILEVSPNNITHSTSTSDINNIIANGYKYESGDVISAINEDYPSNVLPWMLAEKNYDVTFQLLQLDGQIKPTGKWLREKLSPKTKIFCCSHVTFDTGKRMDLIDLGKVCRERDILFIVDTTQALGGIKITQEELSYIDVLSCSSYKWMLGPYGHAFAYFSDKAIELVGHKTANWILSPNSKSLNSLLDYTIETIQGARKYDRGQSANMLAMACFEAGLELMKELTLEKIEKHNAGIRDYFLENFPKNKYKLISPSDYMSNIICLKSQGIDPLELERELKFSNVDVSVRQGNVRLSFHLFNDTDQVNKLIQSLNF